MPSAEEAFRRLTIGDQALIGAMADAGRSDPGVRRLDERTEALLWIGALVALDAPQSSYQAAVGAAQRAGAVLDDLLAVVAAGQHRSSGHEPLGRDDRDAVCRVQPPAQARLGEKRVQHRRTVRLLWSTC